MAEQSQNSGANESGGNVQVTCGANSYSVAVGGKTVAEIREKLGKVMDITDDRTAVINNDQAVPLDDETTTVVQAGASIEFIKQAGLKGNR